MNQNEIFTRIVDRDPAMGLLMVKCAANAGAAVADDATRAASKQAPRFKRFIQKLVPGQKPKKYDNASEAASFWRRNLADAEWSMMPEARVFAQAAQAATSPSARFARGMAQVGTKAKEVGDKIKWPLVASLLTYGIDEGYHALSDASEDATWQAKTDKALADIQASINQTGTTQNQNQATQEQVTQEQVAQNQATSSNTGSGTNTSETTGTDKDKDTKTNPNKDDKNWFQDENNQWSLGLGAAGGLGLYGALGFIPGLDKRRNRLLRALIATAGGVGIGWGVNNLLNEPASNKKTTA